MIRGDHRVRGGGCRQGARVGLPRCVRSGGRKGQGRGEAFPLPAGRLPQWRMHHGPVPGDRWERARYGLPTSSTPDTASHQVSPRTDPAPTAGAGEERRRRGRGGGCRRGIRVSACRRRGRGGVAGRSVWVSLAEEPATRSKVSGALETGEGEQVPPPRQPLPPWRYPHGPQHGEIPEKSRARLLP